MNSVILFHIACGIVIAFTGYSIIPLPAMRPGHGPGSVPRRGLPTMIYQVVGIGIVLAVAAVIYAGATYLAAHNPDDSAYRSLTCVTGALLVIVACMRIMTTRGTRRIIGTNTLTVVILGLALFISGPTLP
ncbi:hypothetical protein [Schaalia odontolytica]|uniref:Uncharacterized protein n=1 Tax=Schaalia odontolytica TaxID=1660 RepID=A0A2X0UJK4_9ACTO|nr:hypothetical protein [Schaalia odontolytica]WMS26783.1 hypothetical protein RDV55_06770 [Schaalia odontolytica]SPT55850.1 Uncharacterised protein [Schaalia odontolytica]